MSHKIIIVDDDYEERREGYERLKDQINKVYTSFSIGLDFVEDPNQLQAMLMENAYSGAIVDAVLDQKWEHFDIVQALRYLGNNIPIAIVSSRWDQTNSRQINEAWMYPNCRTFLHWRDIDPNGSGQIDYAIRSIMGMLTDHLRLDTQFNLGHDDPIRIVHISDVHSGGINQSNVKLEANRDADSILMYWNNNPPTFVAFTGDVAEYGTPGQYKLAREWIEHFFKRLGLNRLPARNLLYVPGNHDVNLSLAAAARVELILDSNTGRKVVRLTDDVKQRDMIRYAYTPFREFLTGVCDCPLINMDTNEDSFAWVEPRFRHLGVIFYGINTAQSTNPLCLPGREVNADALEQISVKLLETVNSCGDSPPLVVGLGHHCPVATNDNSAVENLDVFDKFFRGSVKTALFLHGDAHSHGLPYTSNDGLRLVRSCASTLTREAPSRPSDSFRGFNLLTLERNNHGVTGLTACSLGWVRNDIQELETHTWIKQDDGMFREA